MGGILVNERMMNILVIKLIENMLIISNSPIRDLIVP